MLILVNGEDLLEPTPDARQSCMHVAGRGIGRLTILGGFGLVKCGCVTQPPA